MRKKIYKKHKSFFTLLEMIVSLAVFVIILGIVMHFYSTAFKASESSHSKSMVFENARIALDLMAKDIQTIYYQYDKTPFWNWENPNPKTDPNVWDSYSNELLAFVSATSLPPNDEASKLCEIKYQRYYSHTDTDNDRFGWLRRSVTGNKLSDGTYDEKWNYNDNFVVGYTTDLDANSEPYASFTANSKSNQYYQKVIPYVTELSFKCLDKEGNEIPPSKLTSTSDVTTDETNVTEFPYSVEITLCLMDKQSWKKWVSLGGTDKNIKTADNIEAYTYRKNNERKFTRVVIIGERGQYDE